jgi:hypothetical protein
LFVWSVVFFLELIILLITREVDAPRIYNVRKFVVSIFTEIDGRIADGTMLIQEGEDVCDLLCCFVFVISMALLVLVFFL